MACISLEIKIIVIIKMSESGLKYVHVDTLNRRSEDTKSILNVRVPQGLGNYSRVALNSFSIPNTIPNIVGKKYNG